MGERTMDTTAGLSRLVSTIHRYPLLTPAPAEHGSHKANHMPVESGHPNADWASTRREPPLPRSKLMKSYPAHTYAWHTCHRLPEIRRYRNLHGSTATGWVPHRVDVT